jgi:hypothetical protein
MGKFAEASVVIKADDKPFVADLKGIRGKLSGFAAVAKLAIPIGIAQGAISGITGIANVLGGAVTKAADLGETFSKTRTVLGGDADILIGKAEELSSKFGVVRQEALSAGSNIALIAKGAGLSTNASAKLAAEFTQLAADAGSFFNVGIDEALEKIRAGLTGESEPLKAFGVLLNEAAVQAEAAAMGLGGMNGKLSEGEKVQARASLIMKGMADAQGDLARTSDSTSNQMRKLAGRWEEIQVALGEKLLPVVDSLIPAFGDLADVIDNFGDSSQLQLYVDTFGSLLVGAKELDRLMQGIKVPGLGGASLGVFSPGYAARTIREEEAKQAEMAGPTDIGKKWIEEEKKAQKAAEALEASRRDVLYTGFDGKTSAMRMTPGMIADERARGADVDYADAIRFRAGQQGSNLLAGGRGLLAGLLNQGANAGRGLLAMAGAGLDGAAALTNREQRQATFTDQMGGYRQMQLDALNGGKDKQAELQEKANGTLEKISGGIEAMRGLLDKGRDKAAGVILRGAE